MREAIPHSWNENRVHSITHEKGTASYPAHKTRQPTYDNPVFIVIASPGLVCRASGEAIPYSKSGSKVHVVYLLEGMAS